MDQNAFDGLTRLLAAAQSRRTALAALLGAGLAGTLAATGAARKDRSKKRGNSKGKGKSRSKGAADVTAQAADCLSPGPSSNMNGCNFNNADFSGKNLSSSSMRGTSFRGADLSCANLSSSQLKNADFRGFAAPGRETNLFGANLRSSGCAGVLFNSRTRFCGTIMCNGTIRNDNCPVGVDPETICGGTLPPQSPCTSAAECADDGTGTTRCEDVAFCGDGVTQCCRETGGSCSVDCDCCGFLFCNSGTCGL